MPLNDFLEILIDEVDGKIRKSTLGFAQGGRLALGGGSGPNGGSGIPVGGVVGKLNQSLVTYDTTEAETLEGNESLVDNLNHIRYRIANIQATISGTEDSTAIHVDVPNEINLLEEKEVPVVQDILVIEDSEDSFSKKKILLRDVLGGATLASGQVVRVYNDVLTPQIPDTYYETKYLPVKGTLSVFVNGLHQSPEEYTLSGYYLGIDSLVLGDTLVIDYNTISKVNYYIIPSGYSPGTPENPGENPEWPFTTLSGYGYSEYGDFYYGL